MNLLGSLLLLLLLLLGISVLVLSRGGLLDHGGFLDLLLLLLDSNKETDNLLGLDHEVLIDVELVEDVVNLVALVVGHEGLEDQLIRVVAVSSGQLLLEHVNHAHHVAGTANLSHEVIKLTLSHEDSDVVKSSTKVVLVQGAVLVDVHQLEAVLVHLDLLLGEASLIVLSLAHCVL